MQQYLHKHRFNPCEKFQYLKFRYTEAVHEKLYLTFLECTVLSDIYEHVLIGK